MANFCSACGASVGTTARFCSECGEALALVIGNPAMRGAGAARGPSATDGLSGVAPAVAPGRPQTRTTEAADLNTEFRYDVLVGDAAVNARLRAAAMSARQGTSAEDWMTMFDKLGVVPVPMGKLMQFAVPLGTSLGLKAGTSRTEVVALPLGETIVRTLCSLARNARTIRTVQQGDDGLAIAAVLPSSLWAATGELRVSLTRHGTATEVMALTHIPGQMYAWGSSGRILAAFFDELRTDNLRTSERR